MLTALSTALSALNANSTAISVVGNNLANLNTPGFKDSVVYFSDLATRSIGEGLGETQVGFGTARPATITEFSQGALQTSSGTLDAAIQGDGFFVVTDASGATLYTRAGNFQADASGVLMTNAGDQLQGWTADPTTGAINTNGPVGEIVIPVGSTKPPIATQNFSLDLNLNSAAATTGAPDLSYPIQVYDSLGTAHTLTADFTKTGANQWTYNVSVPGGDISGGTAGTASSVATGSLQFDATGQLTTPAAGSPITFSVAGLTSGASDMNLTWNPYDSTGAGQLTQFGEKSAVSSSAQDGSAPAQLTKVQLADGGQIVGVFSDGQQTVVGQLAMAGIRNPDSLAAEGNNTYAVTADTATPVVGLPGTGGRGQIVGSSIESSTVDVATEFTNLIVYQRAYEANSKVISSADEITQDTINLIH
jgi:flagellar hook protein FlgE